MDDETCCSLHVPGPTGTCCDPDDCGPCCEQCPTCPSAHRLRTAGSLPRGERHRPLAR